MLWRELGFFLILSFLGACSTQAGRISKTTERPSSVLPPVVLMSDFGTFDDGIAIVKGVMLKIQPSLSFVDVTHQIPAFSVREAARFLANTAPYYPEGTVFLVLVERHLDKPARAIVAKSKKGQYFVGSNNGFLTLVAETEGLESVREIKEGPWVNTKKGITTFSGRDIYAPVVARLAQGEDWQGVGPEISDVAFLDKKTFKVSENQVLGDVIALDGPFGNLLTNITATAFLKANYNLGDRVSLTIGGSKHSIPFVKTFDDVPVNEKLLYIDSTDHVAVAINQGSFADKFKVKVPTKFVVTIKPK